MSTSAIDRLNRLTEKDFEYRAVFPNGKREVDFPGCIEGNKRAAKEHLAMLSGGLVRGVYEYATDQFTREPSPALGVAAAVVCGVPAQVAFTVAGWPIVVGKAIQDFWQARQYAKLGKELGVRIE